MGKIELSICIPIFNFGRFIGKTLETLIPQLTEGMEIVILDGGSTDYTAGVIEYYRRGCPQLRYFRQEKRGGIDRDLHRAVELAQGEYCWLFSGDDYMQEGSVERVLRALTTRADVYVGDFTICDFHIDKILDHHRVLTTSDQTVFDLSDSASREIYFKKAEATPAFFSFIGALVVRRDRWLLTVLEESFLESCWAHAVRIFSMIPQGLKLEYLPFSLLRKRSFNDSFMDKGLIHRMGISIDGYHKIADFCFGLSSVEAFHIQRVLKTEFSFGKFLQAKEEIGSGENRKRLFELLQKTYPDHPFKRRLIKLLVYFVPRRAIPFLMKGYNLKRRFLAFLKQA
jgi:abequosyltransferase